MSDASRKKDDAGVVVPIRPTDPPASEVRLVAASRRGGGKRSHTEPMPKPKAWRGIVASLPIYPDDVMRPRLRSECIDGPRPCPFVSCRHHLAIDIKDSGSIVHNFPGVEIDEMAETCALDVADRGGHTLEEVGDLLNMTRERARQIEHRAVKRLRVSRDVFQAREVAEGGVGRYVPTAEDFGEGSASCADDSGDGTVSFGGARGVDIDADALFCERVDRAAERRAWARDLAERLAPLLPREEAGEALVAIARGQALDVRGAIRFWGGVRAARHALNAPPVVHRHHPSGAFRLEPGTQIVARRDEDGDLVWTVELPEEDDAPPASTRRRAGEGNAT